jgi:hypothetical protein
MSLRGDPPMRRDIQPPSMGRVVAMPKLGGLRYTMFCGAWLGRRGLVMRQVHVAGDKAFVDYSAKKARIVDPTTGEMNEVELFVAALAASNLTYAEATRTQQGPDWIASHVRALEYFGGVPAALVPDQLKSCVTRACRYEPETQRSAATSRIRRALGHSPWGGDRRYGSGISFALMPEGTGLTAQAEEGLDLMRWGTRFASAETEARYRAWHVEQAVQLNRPGLFISVAIWSAVLAFFVSLGVALLWMPVIIFVLLPVILWAILTTYRRSLRRWMILSTMVANTVAGVVCVGIASSQLVTFEGEIGAVLIANYFGFAVFRARPCKLRSP